MNESLKLTLEEGKLDDVLTVIFFHVDELYNQIRHLVARSGSKPIFSDSEVITLTLVNQMVIDSQTAWYKFVKRNHKPLFAHLIERSRYHRRSKSLFKLTNLIRRMLLLHLDVHLQQWHLMDSMPVPVCGYTRAGRTHQFAAQFGVTHDSLYGYCAAKQLDFYGFRLHLMVTTQGIVTHFVLAPGSHHHVTVAPELLETYRPDIIVGADKGYVGLAKRLNHPIDYQLIVQSKSNQTPNTAFEKSFWLVFAN